MSPKIAPLVHLSTTPLCPRVRALFQRRPILRVADPARLPRGQRAAGWLITVSSPADEDLLEEVAGWVQNEDRSLDRALVLHASLPTTRLFNRSAVLGQMAMVNHVEPVASFFAARLDDYVADQGPRWALVDLPSSPLSRREVEVAELAIEGWPYGVIGAKLGVAKRTVECHIRRILGKHDLAGRRVVELRARCSGAWQ